MDFWVQVDSVEQPIELNSVCPGHVSHRRTSALDDHFDHDVIVFKKCRASHKIEKTSRLRKHNRHCIIQDRRAELESWFSCGCACLMACHAASFPVLFLWISLIGQGKSGTLRRPNPKDQEREFHPCVDLHQERWYQIPSNCVKKMFAVLAHRTYGNKRVTSKYAQYSLRSILSLQALRQSQSFETVPVCFVVQCFPHDNIAGSHLCDEF